MALGKHVDTRTLSLPASQALCDMHLRASPELAKHRLQAPEPPNNAPNTAEGNAGRAGGGQHVLPMC
eukprot:3660815-Alexandrium_andersonii.AAC.1